MNTSIPGFGLNFYTNLRTAVTMTTSIPARGVTTNNSTTTIIKALRWNGQS
jgi:hypothetical protein